MSWVVLSVFPDGTVSIIELCPRRRSCDCGSYPKIILFVDALETKSQAAKLEPLS